MDLVKIITGNIWWKLFALLIAVLLWIAVANEPELSTFVSVPIEFKDLPDTLEISSAIVEQVELEMRGPSGELRNFTGNRTAVVLDMSDAMPGERTYTIRAADVHLPRTLQVIRVIPPGVRFVFERRKQKSVPVEVRFNQEPPRFQVTPHSLTIEGPESRVNQVHSVVTDLIDLSKLNGAGTFHVSALAGDPHVRINSDADVTVQVWK
jgi:YbbR domain-containing protein